MSKYKKVSIVVPTKFECSTCGRIFTVPDCNYDCSLALGFSAVPTVKILNPDESFDIHHVCSERCLIRLIRLSNFAVSFSMVGSFPFNSSSDVD